LVLADRPLLQAPVAPFGLLLPLFALISSALFLGDHIRELIAAALLAISGSPSRR
jgi:O-acetylserine/cysteine efflux transporter